MPVGMFIIHDLSSRGAQQVRCEWLNEYLHWADRDQPALYFVLAKLAKDNNMVHELKDGITKMYMHRGESEYLRLFNNTSACKGCSLHYLPFFLISGKRGYDQMSKNFG